MTFASKDNKYFFGLPGNPVSAFVTFHLFALPAIRWAAGTKRDKCTLAEIQVIVSSSFIVKFKSLWNSIHSTNTHIRSSDRRLRFTDQINQQFPFQSVYIVVTNGAYQFGFLFG